MVKEEEAGLVEERKLAQTTGCSRTHVRPKTWIRLPALKTQVSALSTFAPCEKMAARLVVDVVHEDICTFVLTKPLTFMQGWIRERCGRYLRTAAPLLQRLAAAFATHTSTRAVVPRTRQMGTAINRGRNCN
jgi:hypothetical protein